MTQFHLPGPTVDAAEDDSQPLDQEYLTNSAAEHPQGESLEGELEGEYDKQVGDEGPHRTPPLEGEYDEQAGDDGPHQTPPLEGQYHEQAGDDGPHQAPPRQENHGSQSEQPHYHVPTKQQVQATLARLPLLILTDKVAPAKANAARAALQVLLNSMGDETAKSKRPEVETSRLRDTVRTHPEILDALAPLLSAEQLADLVNADDDDDFGGGSGDRGMRN